MWIIRDLEEFRRAFPDYPSLLRAIAVSVDELPPHGSERYLDLAVFSEDAPIPEGPLQVLWNLTPVKTRACLDRPAHNQQTGRRVSVGRGLARAMHRSAGPDGVLCVDSGGVSGCGFRGSCFLAWDQPPDQ